MAKKAKIRFSGYYPEAIIQAIKKKAEVDGLSDNEAAIKLLEAGIISERQKPGSFQTESIPAQTDPPKGLTGLALTIWKAEQKAKK